MMEVKILLSISNTQHRQRLVEQKKGFAEQRHRQQETFKEILKRNLQSDTEIFKEILKIFFKR